MSIDIFVKPLPDNDWTTVKSSESIVSFITNLLVAANKAAFLAKFAKSVNPIINPLINSFITCCFKI